MFRVCTVWGYKLENDVRLSRVYGKMFLGLKRWASLPCSAQGFQIPMHDSFYSIGLKTPSNLRWEPIIICFYLFFETGFSVSWSLLCRQGRPRTHEDLLASASLSATSTPAPCSSNHLHSLWFSCRSSRNWLPYLEKKQTNNSHKTVPNRTRIF